MRLASRSLTLMRRSMRCTRRVGRRSGQLDGPFPVWSFRARLSDALKADPDGFEILEEIVHPLVSAARDAFIAENRAEGQEILVFDVPLLFETGGENHVDAVIVVHAPDDVRRARVMQRPGMTDDKLDAIIARQLDDSIKLERADHVVETSGGLEDARRQVTDIVSLLQRRARSEQG